MSDQTVPPPLPPQDGPPQPPPPPTASNAGTPAPPPMSGNAGSPAPPPSTGNAGTPEPVDPLAQQHVTEQTRTYPCTACGGDLHFDISQQKLACPHCGSIQEVSASGPAQLVEKDVHAAIQAMKNRAEDHKTVVEGEKEVVCQNCGGHTTFTGSLTSTRCPYCATPIQRDDIHDAPARLAVDGVLPFAVDQKQSKEIVEKWINSRWFAPNEFKKYSTTGSFNSVYAAYFAFDGEAWTNYRGQRGDNHTVTTGSGDNRQTRTEIRWRSVSGQVYNQFVDMTVLANTGLDHKRVTALEPWPTDQVRPFSPEYIAGHLCRTYDNDVGVCFGEAQTRMNDEIETTIKRDIGGDHQRISSKESRFANLTFVHLLLPIWLLTVIYQGQPYQVFINGVTGEVQGERPYSKIKIALAVTAAVIVAIIAFLIFGSDGG